MSDVVKDLAKQYEDYVLDGQHPRSIGLFPIPEYPELEAGRGMWSAVLQVILTTLRYLAPATILTLFWGQQSFLFKLVKSIDSAFRAIVFSSEEQKQEALQWLVEVGPVRIDHLETVWRHGWILCGVLDSALPGACAGHPPTRLSLKHAQSIADHYLGVEPVFSRQELESNDTLSRHQEWKFATYLNRIREALSKVPPPNSKAVPQKTSPEIATFTLDYAAKGTGLTAAQINNQMHFKIYPTSQQSLDPGEITVFIRGPEDTYGMKVIPPVLGKAQLIRQNMLGLQSKPNYTENALPITQGTTYLRSYGMNDMNKTYYIPKAHYDIDIETENLCDHARISYVVDLEGKYEISITSRGQNIVGSPFTMTATKNIINVLETDGQYLEDGEEIDIVDVKTDRKVVLRIVDFVTEKMLLKENGSLKKISDEEANILMSTDKKLNDLSELDCCVSEFTKTKPDEKSPTKLQYFKETVEKVKKMNKVCKVFTNLTVERHMISKKKKLLDQDYTFVQSRSQQDVPDIVNSTFSDLNVNIFTTNNQDKYIIPENITVSLRTEKEKPSPSTTETLAQRSYPHLIEDDILIGGLKTSSSPFLNEIYDQNYAMEKELGSFVKTEYETNNSQNEETEGAPIKIIVFESESNRSSPINANPLIEPDIINIERPKTPVLKIITGNVENRDESVYIDAETERLVEEGLLNEFINPLFKDQRENQSQEKIPITDFIIGAPVSLPPMIRAPTPDPNMDSLLITSNKNTATGLDRKQDSNSDVSGSIFSIPIHTKKIKTNETNKSHNTLSISSTFHSLDTNVNDNMGIINLPGVSEYQEEYNIDRQTSRDVTPKKDTWDSAYVSIDDNNSSPDSNNNDNSQLSETTSKHKFTLSDEISQLSNMGPAERELWHTCAELKNDQSQQYEDIKIGKWEVKRPLFTPILEERTMSTGLKGSARPKDIEEIDSVTVAFAKPQYVTQDYLSDCRTPASNKNAIHENTDKDKQDDTSVNSASAISDVKRHAKEIEGEISEVQANVTESISVSQILHITNNGSINHYNDKTRNDKTQFGDSKKSNIVLEKKQYWDEKIREIEAKSEESTNPQKRKKLSPKNLRLNDSLTKRRGKQIVKNFLSNSDQQIVNYTVNVDKNTQGQNNSNQFTDSLKLLDEPQDEKLVEKWKKYWDEKLETEKEVEISCFRPKPSKTKENSVSPQVKRSMENIHEIQKVLTENKTLPVKQDLPEEVFKAFETSPKRFFGTSRKQILNKIDTFLGKPSSVDESSTDISGAIHHDTGLVSSRISLFHNISQTEEVPWARRKCQSMHNIFQRKDSERSNSSVDEKFANQFTMSVDESNYKTEKKNPTVKKFEPKQGEKIPDNATLKEKRARVTHKNYTATFVETITDDVSENVFVETQVPSVKKAISHYSRSNQTSQKNNTVLQKSSISRSEMDIFKKIHGKPEEDDFDKYKSCDELPKINVKSFISLYENVSKPDISRPMKKSNLRIHSSSSSVAANKVGVLHDTNSSQFSSLDDHSNSMSTTDLTTSLNQWPSKDFGSKNIKPDVEIVSTLDTDKETTYLSLSDIELEIVEKLDNIDKETEVSQTDYRSRFKSAKQFFQSLEELNEVKRPTKLNECELLLKKSTESAESLEEKEKKPEKKSKGIKKSHSMPSSEISKYWIQLQESKDGNNKPVKISEKYNVEDLFSDVMEGRFKRQGSLKGVPHRKAVLEAFKSMENFTDNKISPYEISASHLQDFSKDNNMKNAQTYLSEYPYLPMTDPSKYQSRLDTKATGLISLKELLNQKPRRNSVPDIRLDTKFSVNL